MAISDIKLTSSMRTNLLALQSTQKKTDKTQERLSTGMKVNSALDAPSAYFSAQSLSNRASDLSTLLDSMGQGIQLIKATDNALTTLNTFAEQAKAIVQMAQDTNVAADVKTYAAQFNEVLKQMSELVKNEDSGYKGVNLLKEAAVGTNATFDVIFNESRTSKLTLQGVNFDVKDGTNGDIKISDASWIGPKVAGKASGTTGTLDGTSVVTDGETIIIQSSGKSVTVTGSSTSVKLSDLASQVTSVFNGDVAVSYDGGYLTITNNMEEVLTVSGSSNLRTGLTSVAAATVSIEKNAIAASMTAVEGSISSIRTQSMIFAQNMSVLQTRQDFTSNLINTLTTGADNLTLADMNEEGANMLALQVRQQLGINALSLSSQAQQGVLSLF